MADLKVIIAKLAQQMQAAADQIDGSATPSPSQSTGDTGSGAKNAIERLERQVEIAKKLGDEKEKIKQIEMQIARIRAEAAAESGDDAEVERYKELRRTMEETQSFAESLQGSFGGLKDALEGPFQQITGFNKSVYGLARNIQKGMFGGIKKGAKGAIAGFKMMKGGLGGLSKAFTAAGAAGRSALAAATAGLSILLEMVIKVATVLATITGGVVLDLLGFADNMGAAFARLTGTTDRFNNSLAAVGDEAFRLGISAERSAKTMADLTQKFSGFNNLSEKAASSMATQVLFMEELGVASSTQIAVLDSLNRVMGMTAQQSMEFSKDLFDMASAARMAPEEMMASFRDALPQLSVYGSKMKGEFQKLTAQSKSTGMSVKELLSVVGKFDTFDGAANAAQGLNAYLGGPYLNTIELLTATESERVDLLRDSFARSGKEFKDLDRFAQKGIAKQLGMSVDQARRTFSMSTKEVEKYNKALKLAEQANTNLKERVRETQPFMDTLKTAFLDVGMSMLGAISGSDAVGGGMKSMQEVMKVVYKDVIPPLIKGFFMITKMVLFMTRMFAGFMTFVMKGAAALGLTDKANVTLMQQFSTGLEKAGRGLSKMEPKMLARMQRIGEDRAQQGSKQNDFIYSGGKVHPVDSRDQFMGAKPTGFFDTSQKQMSRKLDALTDAINRLASKSSGDVRIEMDGREVARMVDKRMQDNYSFNLPSSGRVR